MTHIVYFLKVNSTSENVQKWLSILGHGEPPCPYLGMNLRAEAAPAHLKGWPSSYHPPLRDSCRAYQCSLILLHSSDTPGEPHRPPHLLALEAALEAFTAPLSKFSDIHSSWSFTKAEWLTLTNAVRQQTRHCPFIQGLSPPAPLHRRSSVFIKVLPSPKCCTDLSRQFKVEWVKTLFPSNESLREGAEVECEKCKAFSQDLLDTHL